MNHGRSPRAWILLVLLAALSGCGEAPGPAAPPAVAPTTAAAVSTSSPPAAPVADAGLPAANGTPPVDTSGPPALPLILDVTIEPHVGDLDEVLVLPKDARAPANLEEFSGLAVHVRRASSYHDSLVALNATLASAGLAPVRIVALDENLDTDEALEMLNAGLIPATVADRYIAKLWQGVLPEIQVVESVPLRSGGRLAWAVRPDSPALAHLVSEFQVAHGKGTLWGNMKAKEYFGTGDFIRNPEREAERARLAEVTQFFREYGDRYSMD